MLGAWWSQGGGAKDWLADAPAARERLGAEHSGAARATGLLDRKSVATFSFICAVVLTVALCEKYTRLYYGNVVDDAATSMQYAKNLALGHGLVFNAGERVEGYTNFLWVVFQAPLYAVTRWLGVSYVPVLVQVNIVIAAAVTLLTGMLARRLFGPLLLPLLVVLALCVADNSFTCWAVFGLENHFLTLFMLLALLATRQSSPKRWLWSGLSLAAAHLTRPDAGLFAAVVVLNEIVEGVIRSRMGPGIDVAARKQVRDGLLTAVVWLGIYAIYFALRYGYYGYPSPNTYYLKLGGPIDAWARGADYVRGFFETRAYLPALAAFALLGVRDRTVRALLVYLSLHTLYVAYAGGDFFSGHRFFVTQVPLFALLVGVGLSSAWQLVERSQLRRLLDALALPAPALAGMVAAGAAVAVHAVFTLGRTHGPLQHEIFAWRDDLRSKRKLFTWFDQHVPKDSSIATCLIGHTGFFGNRRVVDLCGVIDTVTAHREVANFGHGKAGHEKTATLAHVLAQRPTFVIDGYLPGDLWRHGYYFGAEPPRELIDGVWVRDTLPERARREEGAGFSFNEAADGFRRSGNAFDAFPAFGQHAGQGVLRGAVSGFVNSYHPSLGNRATGRLESPSFRIAADLVVLRLAGGHDPERLRVSLTVDGRRVFSETGRRSDAFTRRTWDTRALKGTLATIEVVDEVTEAWGYIAVDEIEQWIKLK